MAYTKQTWTDRQGTKLNRFTKANETLTSVELTNNPATITQAGTPFSKTRMDYIEEGIRTGHVIGTPLSDLNRVFRLTGDGIPIFPDNVAGRTYWQDDWATTDGFAGINCTPTVSSGALIATASGTAAFSVRKTGMSYTNRLVRIKFKSFTRVGLYKVRYHISTTLYEDTQFTVVPGQYIYDVYLQTPGTYLSVDVFCSVTGSAGDSFQIDTIYIGSGLYDTPVYDKSCCNRFTNNGVLPVPAPRGLGMLFQGAQYLKADNPVIGTTGTIFISFAVGALSPSTTKILVDGRNSSFRSGITVYQLESNVIQIGFADASGMQNVSTGTVTSTGRYTVAVAFTPSSAIPFFNGVQGTTTAITVGSFASLTNLQIGARSTLAADGFFNGTIYDIGFDSRLWTADDALRYHNGDDAVDSQQKAVTAVPHSIVTRDANGGINASNMFAYDLVIDSDAKLASWAASGTWEKVLIKKGTWTLASGGVDLTARGTKVVIGEPGSKLVFSASANGLYYSTRPTTNNYKMDGVNVECSNTSGSVLAIRDCINLKECTAIATSYGAASTAGFAYCYNMINCIGTGSGSTVGSGFSDCLYCVNCKGFGSGSNEGIGFGSCRYLSGCYASGTGIGTGIGDGLKLCLRVTICESYGYTGTGSSYGMAGCKSCTNNKAFAGTANYSNSYADSGTSYACADTPNGGFNS